MEKIKAEIREVGRKGVNNRLRKENKIPAILYGQGVEPLSLALPAKEFTHLMKGSSGTNTLFDLELGGSDKNVTVMLKDYQTDTLTKKLTHLDLLRINLSQKISVKIPVHIVGKAIGVTQGGLIEQGRREIEVKCFPNKIPQQIDVDITHLEVGHSLHIHEIKLPEGVEIPHGADFVVVSINLPREEVAAAASSAEAAVVGAEGAAAGAAAPAGDAKDAKAEKPEKKEKGK